MNDIKIIDEIKKFIKIPKNFNIVYKKEEIRNNEKVKIYRFQESGKFEINTPRIIVITDIYGNIESIKNLSCLYKGELLNSQEAKKKAIDIFN